MELGGEFVGAFGVVQGGRRRRGGAAVGGAGAVTHVPPCQARDFPQRRRRLEGDRRAETTSGRAENRLGSAD